MNTVNGGDGGAGTLIETASDGVIGMSMPTTSSTIGLVVLLDLLLLDRERAASNPQHIIELIIPKVQVKASRFHQKDIDIVIHPKSGNSQSKSKAPKLKSSQIEKRAKNQ